MRALGNVPSTDLPLENFSAIADRVYAGTSRLSLAADPHAAPRAPLRTPDFRPAPTAGGSRQSQRLDSAATAASLGTVYPRSRRRSTHIQKGRFSLKRASLER